MSLDNSPKLKEVAKLICQDLRRNPTKTEKVFWEAIRSRRFYGKKFYRQFAVFHDITGKETFFIADFYCYSKKLIIELDGKYHQYRLKEDEKRTEILNRLGLKVIRFSNDEIIHDLDRVLCSIKRYTELKIEINSELKSRKSGNICPYLSNSKKRSFDINR